MRSVLRSAGVVLFFAEVLLSALTGVAQTRPADVHHTVVAPADIQWKALRPGAEIAVLSGDPAKVGSPFVIRFRYHGKARIPPHWHPVDENLTVLSGTFRIGMGERGDEAATTALGVGAYALVPAKMPHYADADDNTIIQAHGIGPFVINYVNPADDPANAGPKSTMTALHFGHVWDGARLSDKVTVLVDESKIVAVGSRVPIPKGSIEVDLRRYTAIPGLIDLHTHITYYWDRAAGTTPLKQGAQRTADDLFERAFDNARKTLETGVTTIRDLGASRDVDYRMRDAVNSGQKVGPRMFVAGAGLSAPRGGTPNTLDQWRQVVTLRVQSGSDWIKVYGSRGSYQSVDTTQTLTLDEMKAIVDAAHSAGKPVAIHSYGASGVHDAVLAGADSIEHGIEIDDATFQEMVRRGTVWVPTIDHNRYYVDAKDEYQFAAETIPPLQDYIKKNFEATARAFKLGVKLGMGSDAVYTGFGQNTGELTWFVKAGMTPAQALATATTIPAALLKHETDLGRIAPGFYADIVAIDGEPLKDIQAVIKNVTWVMKDGKVVVDKR